MDLCFLHSLVPLYTALRQTSMDLECKNALIKPLIIQPESNLKENTTQARLTNVTLHFRHLCQRFKQAIFTATMLQLQT